MTIKPTASNADQIAITVTELDNGNIQIPWIDGRNAEFRDMTGEDMEHLQQFGIDYDGTPTPAGMAYKTIELLCVGIESEDEPETITVEMLRKLPGRQFTAVMAVFVALSEFFRFNSDDDSGGGDGPDPVGDDNDSGSAAN